MTSVISALLVHNDTLHHLRSVQLGLDASFHDVLRLYNYSIRNK